MKNLEKLYNECVNELNSIGIILRDIGEIDINISKNNLFVNKSMWVTVQPARERQQGCGGGRDWAEAAAYPIVSSRRRFL